MSGRPYKWDTDKGKELWDSGMVLKEMSEVFGIHIVTITNFAKAHAWKPRKAYNRATPHAVAPKPCNEKPVTRRCPRCLAAYKSPLSDNEPHCKPAPRLVWAA